MGRRWRIVAWYYGVRRWLYRSTGYRWYRLQDSPCPYGDFCGLCKRCGRCVSHGRPCMDDPAGDLIDAEIGKWALERREERGE